MLKCGQIQESLVNVGFFQFFRKLDVSSRNLAETWAFMGKFGSGEISQFFWKLDVSSRNHAETWAITGKFGSGKISLFFFEKTGRIKQKPCWNAGNCRKVWFLPDLTDIFENWVELVQTMLKCGRLRKVWSGEISQFFWKLDVSSRNHTETWDVTEKLGLARFHQFFENWMDQVETILTRGSIGKKFVARIFWQNWYSDICQFVNDSKGSCEKQVETWTHSREMGCLAFRTKKVFRA